jgi:hypothetical protein
MLLFPTKISHQQQSVEIWDGGQILADSEAFAPFLGNEGRTSRDGSVVNRFFPGAY